MIALDKAKELWDNPVELIYQWDTDESKIAQEKLISKIVGSAGNIVDLGCGIGRYSKVLKGIKHYQGYDSSSEMIHFTKSTKKFEYACVDITSFQINKGFDTGLLIDVAYHQPNPIEFIKKIIQLWSCKRLFFTLLVGPEHENLYNSIVIGEDDFKQFLEEYKFSIEYSEDIRTENFRWVVCKL